MPAASASCEAASEYPLVSTTGMSLRRFLISRARSTPFIQPGIRCRRRRGRWADHRPKHPTQPRRWRPADVVTELPKHFADKRGTSSSSSTKGRGQGCSALFRYGSWHPLREGAPLFGISRHDEFRCRPISVASGASFAFEGPQLFWGPPAAVSHRFVQRVDEVGELLDEGLS